MSQAGRYLVDGGADPIETLTGNSGGAVPPTGGNINIVGTGAVDVAGNPGTSTLTISIDETVAETFTTDSGVATPVANNIDIIGGTGITTSAVGDTIVITATGGASGIIQLEGDNGDIATGPSVNVLGGNNITTSGDNVATITINVSGTTNHTLQVGNASGSLTSLGIGTAGQVMTSNGAGNNPAFDNIGTDSGLTAHSVVLAQGAGAFTALGIATNGQLIIGSTGVDPVLSTLTAGTNVAITNGAGSISIAANTAAQIVAYTGIVFASSPYTVLATDYYIGADVTGGAITVRLPNSPSAGRIFVVKDVAGLAAGSNITVTTVGGAVNIDGATSFVMNTAYESASFIFNGATYEIY